jgi:4-hydroxybenzoate polyprenyltransferase
MKFLRLFLHMIRYRSALVLVLFMALSVLIHGPRATLLFSWPSLYMALALVCVYACATCVNDLADWEIDAINLKGHADRPLVTGEGNRRDLVILAVVTACVAIGLASLVNLTAVFVVLLGLMMNTIYSLRPVQISHRAVVTPFYLAFCYVLVSYLAGYTITLGTLQEFNWLYFVAFYFLFLARISLKDFRDRKGDAQAKKPTLILKYGKNIVCLLSFTSLLMGGVCLLFALGNRPYLQVVVAMLLLSLLVVEYKLFITKKELLELLSVGYGARMGNGILFSLLGTLLLEAYGAGVGDIIVFYCGLLLVYGWMFWQYIKHPELFYFGKKKVA